MAEEMTEVGADGGIADEAQPGGIAGEDGAPGGIAEETGGGDGKGDAKAGGGSGKAAPAGEGKDAPVAYELAAPADFPLPEANLKSFSEACHKLGLSREQAEGMLHWHRDFHTAVSGEAQAAEARALDGWQKEMQADRDFGGTNMKATVACARKALAAFDPDGSLRSLLRESNYQYNPAVIRAIARIGRAMGEHDFIGEGGGGKADVPLEERLYRNMETGK